MPYSTSLKGVSESILDALKGLFVAGITDLNTQLQTRSAPLSSITAVSGMFRIGDTETLPAPATYPFWVCIVGGGKQDGRDAEIEIKQTGPGYWTTYYHNIYLYIHPDSFPGSDAVVQAEARERLRSLLQDWAVNGVLNNGTNYTITLGSRQYATAPAYDTLDECKVTDVTKGYVFKSFGGTNGVFMMHLTHRGRTYGGY